MGNLVITILPSILILTFFFTSDKFKEPKITILIVLILGILICFPAGILNSFISNILDGKYNENFIRSFLSSAWVEELLKFSILYFIVLRRNEFNEPMDGIVYGVAVSLGFATYENYDYVFRLAPLWKIDSTDVAIYRSFTAVPLHALMGCIMGFYFGKYSFTSEKKYLILSMFVPYLLHGLYNYNQNPLNLFIVAVTIVYALMLHASLKKLQKLKKTESEPKKI